MKAFTKFYEAKVEELWDAHDKWVQSNLKMRSIELALRQIKSEGDTLITPAEDVLRKEYDKEKRRNDELCTNAHALKNFVRSMEIEAREYGVEWDKAVVIFGY